MDHFPRRTHGEKQEDRRDAGFVYKFLTRGDFDEDAETLKMRLTETQTALNSITIVSSVRKRILIEIYLDELEKHRAMLDKNNYNFFKKDLTPMRQLIEDYVNSEQIEY